MYNEMVDEQWNQVVGRLSAHSLQVFGFFFICEAIANYKWANILLSYTKVLWSADIHRIFYGSVDKWPLGEPTVSIQRSGRAENEVFDTSRIVKKRSNQLKSMPTHLFVAFSTIWQLFLRVRGTGNNSSLALWPARDHISQYRYITWGYARR